MTLETSVIETDEPSTEHLQGIERCNFERRVRLGLDQPSSGFLGNTDDPPAGALAHYEVLDGLDYFTVYNEHIVVESSQSYAVGKTTVPFREIQNLSKTYGGFGTLELEFEGDYKMTTQLSLALFSPTEAMRAEQAVEGAHRAHVSTPAAAVPDW